MTDVRSVALLSVELWEHKLIKQNRHDLFQFIELANPLNWLLKSVIVVERTGLEPVTLRLSDENSNQLNYLSTDNYWCAARDSNSARPH